MSDDQSVNNGEALSCQDCDGSTRVWFAPNATWNAVMGSDGGMLCPGCFIDRAEAIGMVPTAWVLTMERHGRTWTWTPSTVP
jgi:hypothetical protein